MKQGRKYSLLPDYRNLQTHLLRLMKHYHGKLLTLKEYNHKRHFYLTSVS